jgi:hypothetical protein
MTLSFSLWRQHSRPLQLRHFSAFQCSSGCKCCSLWCHVLQPSPSWAQGCGFLSHELSAPSQVFSSYLKLPGTQNKAIFMHIWWHTAVEQAMSLHAWLSVYGSSTVEVLHACRALGCRSGYKAMEFCHGYVCWECQQARCLWLSGGSRSLLVSL